MNSNYSAQEKNFATALLHNLWKYLLLAVSIVATVKIIFFGFDIDEQYAVSMAYRLVQGDRMFLEMWEPHQTSAFFSAAFLWLYIQLFHTLTYSVLFLRIVGVVTQLIISILTYRTFRKFVTANNAFVIAVFYYNIIPKNSTVPDFSNMLLWFSTLVFLSFLEFSLHNSASSRHSAFFLIAAGVSTSLLVLSYPTCIFVVLPGCIGIWLLSATGARLKNLLIYLGTCGVCGLGWLAYFLCHMSFRQFLDGLSEMLTDGSHDVGLLGKLKDNLSLSAGRSGDCFGILVFFSIHMPEKLPFLPVVDYFPDSGTAFCMVSVAKAYRVSRVRLSSVPAVGHLLLFPP